MQRDSKSIDLKLLWATVECMGRCVKLPIFVKTGGQATCLNHAFVELAPGVDISCWDRGRYLKGSIDSIRMSFTLDKGN